VKRPVAFHFFISGRRGGGVVEPRANFTGRAGYPPRLQREGKLELTEAPRSQIAAEGIPEGFRELKPGWVALGGARATRHYHPAFLDNLLSQPAPVGRADIPAGAGGETGTFTISAENRLRFPQNCVNISKGVARTEGINGRRTITAGTARRTWRSVKGDRLGSGLSPFYFLNCRGGSFPIARRSGLTSTARVQRGPSEAARCASTKGDRAATLVSLSVVRKALKRKGMPPPLSYLKG